MSDVSLAQALLSPRTVALVGASGDIRKNTARPLRFMRKHKFDGHIYPINPARDEILGERAWPSLTDLPEPIDHVFVMIPGKDVYPVLADCAKSGAKVVTIFSDGFGEAGPEGQKRQAELVSHARSLGLRLLGPNSIGVADLHTGSVISVNAAFEADDLIAGGVSLVSQSGSMMGSLMSRGAARGFGFAKTLSVGNESDISVGEIVDALVDDPDTKVILLFLETLRDSPTLARALIRARQAGMPVVAYKLGRSEQGDALAQSHTGAIAGNDAAIDAFFRAYGVRRVRALETLLEIIPLVTRYAGYRPTHAGSPRVAVITTTGGGAATVVDNLGVRGLTAVAPPMAFVEHMATRGLTIRQTPVIDLTLAGTSAQYKDLLDQLLQSDWCDAVLSVAGSSAQFHPELVVQPLLTVAKPADKPLVAFLAPEAMASLALLRAGGIAAFRTPESCADALAVFFEADHGHPCPGKGDVMQPWPADLPRTGSLTEREAGAVFQALGVPVARSVLLSPDNPRHDIPYPVVAKVSSRQLAHKTEAGGVHVGIDSDQALRTAIATILADVARHAPQAAVEGILVQQMHGKLVELILGYRVDALVGPTVLLGAGGVTAELIPDFSIRLAPVTLAQAREMIKEVRVTQLIRGFRGLPLGDCEALAAAIERFSRLALLRDVTVAEAEINPLFVDRDGVVAVDGLLRLAQ